MYAGRIVVKGGQVENGTDVDTKREQKSEVDAFVA